MMHAAPVLTAQQMRDAEQGEVARGVSLATLMDRAGRALADIVWRMAAGRPISLLCGPGNNGGDGYVAARYLAERGADTHVFALAEPSTDLARDAHSAWGRGVGSSADAPIPGAIMVDCLFGTGLSRPLTEDAVALLTKHAGCTARIVCADVPSGVGTDDGALLGCPISADVTLAFGALKPAHLLFPSAERCGKLLWDPIGIACSSDVHTAAPTMLAAPRAGDHKYTSGLVAVVAGSMPGAAELAARAALRGGAGYVRLIGSALPPAAPHAIVRQARFTDHSLDDARIGAVVIGCGLGQGDVAAERLRIALAARRPLVIDGDGLSMLPDHLPLDIPAILTPHAGEFARLFGDGEGSKIERTQHAARTANAVVIFKGADSVMAAPDGRVAICSPGNPWLATAGTGDVLAGLCGAMLARGLPVFEAAQAAVLLHQRAAVAAGPGLCADDLVRKAIFA